MKRFYKITALFLVITIVLVGVCQITAFADTQPTDESDHDGYIIKYSDDAVILMSNDDSMEYVMPGVYVTEDLEKAQQLEALGMVEYVEPNVYVKLAEVSLNGTYYTDWPYVSMQANLATENNLLGEGVRVAIIDTGLDDSNYDLQNATIARGYDYVNNTSTMTDSEGHGTFVAQMIAGDNNGVAETGVAPKATIVPLKCFEGESDATISDLSHAIVDAYSVYDCDVINMSWGTYSQSTTLYSAINAAYQAGVILIASAGNVDEGDTSYQVSYPAAYSQVIGVGSLTDSGAVAAHSQQTSAVTVCAPGENIVVVGNDDNLWVISGTSFAAPIIAGLAAVVKQISPNLTPDKFAYLAQHYVEDLGPAGYDVAYGYGYLNFQTLFYTDWQNATFDSGSVTIDGWHKNDTNTSTVVSTYNENGRMLEGKVVDNTGSVATFSVTMNTTKVSKIKVAYLDDTMCPLTNMVEYLIES